MFLSGVRHTCGVHHASKRNKALCPIANCASNIWATDLAPGMTLLSQEYSAGRIIRLDEQTHSRLVEFAMHGEEYTDVIKRLLDVAASAAKAKLQRQQRQQRQQKQEQPQPQQ
jgi:predicted N-formylglutamate amidohydrolase